MTSPTRYGQLCGRQNEGAHRQVDGRSIVLLNVNFQWSEGETLLVAAQSLGLLCLRPRLDGMLSANRRSGPVVAEDQSLANVVRLVRMVLGVLRQHGRRHEALDPGDADRSVEVHLEVVRREVPVLKAPRDELLVQEASCRDLLVV
eukprot:scaffold2724_cov260-Pinguiococcus_pyrenoidosus.AAC.4